jgi:predicted lipoprotein
MVPATRAFRDRSVDLAAALAVATEPAAAQEAFVESMLQWQELEVLQLGPAAAVGSPAGGEGLRDRIYSWPTIDPCAVDTFIASGAPSEPTFFADALVDDYGLDALEQLLFSGPEPVCGDWGALSVAEVDARRLAHARLLAADVTAAADALVTAWEGDYPNTLASSDPDEAMDAVFQAMFYIELQTKDRKLGIPLGLGDCSDACEAQAELRKSGVGAEAIRRNLKAFESLYAAGMDDIIRDQVGSEDLADYIDESIADAQQEARNLDGDVGALVSRDAEAVEDVYAAVKTLTDVLKLDLVTVLELEIPQEAASDLD